MNGVVDVKRNIAASDALNLPKAPNSIGIPIPFFLFDSFLIRGFFELLFWGSYV